MGLLQFCRSSRYIGWLGTLTIILLSLVPLSALGEKAGKPDEAAHEIQPDQPLPVVLAPAAEQSFSVFLSAGRFAILRIEQLQGTTLVTISGASLRTAPQYGSDAGAHSVIEVPVLVSQDSTVQLHLKSRDKYVPVRLSVTMTEPRAELLGDAEVIAAHDALAQAEFLRRARRAADVPLTLEAYDKAVDLARKVADPLLEEQAWIGKSRSYLYEAGDYLAGLKCAEQAVHLIPANDDIAIPDATTAIEALGWKTLSSAYSFLAKYPEMLAATNRSLELYHRLGDLYWEGILEGNAANVYLETGDMQHAQAAAEEGLAIAQKLDDRGGVAFTLATLAVILRNRNEYQAALDANNAALKALQDAPDPDETAQIWLNIADIYDDLNELEQERNAMDRAIPLLRQVHDAANESGALCAMGMLDLKENHLSEAERLLRESMEIARKQQLHREQSMAFLGTAKILAAEGKTSEEAKVLQQGLALALNAHEAETHALLLQAEGDRLAQMGEIQQALNFYGRSETEWSAIPRVEQAMLARASIARLEFHSSQTGKAHDDILLALDGFEASRSQIGSRFLRESFFAARHNSYDLAIEILMQRSTREGQAVVSERENSIKEAWEIAERSRAQSLMDAIRHASNLSTEPVSKDLVESSVATENNIAEAEREVLKIGEAGGKQQALRDAEDKLRSLIFEADQTEAREKGSASGSAAWPSEGLRSPTITNARADLLDLHTALLEYWVGQHSSYLWVITDKNITSARLPGEAVLSRALDRYKAALLAREDYPAGEDLRARQVRIARADSDVGQLSAALGRQLIPHLDSAIQRLIVVPDGPLASIPFSALSRSEHRYLIQDYELEEEPSAAVAIALQSRPSSVPSAQRIAVFADPVYSRDDPRLKEQISIVADSNTAPKNADHPLVRGASDFDVDSLPRLSGSATEANAIAELAGKDRVNLYLGFQASPEEVMKTPWRNYAAVDFAAHAIVDFHHPELSGIVLSTLNSKGESQDGILWLHEIYRTPMPLSLVLLSGCRTANGKSIPGEGIAGLAQAFLASGASGVIGNLWTVDDAASSQMVPLFYKELLVQGLSISAALRAAQLQLITTPSLRSPYDWAGFIFEGNGETHISLP